MLVKRLILAVVAALSLLAGVKYRNAKQNATQLRSENKALKAQAQTLTTQYELTEEAYQALSATRLQIQTKTRTVIKRIKTAPAGDDAPVAPVLREALESIE